MIGAPAATEVIDVLVGPLAYRFHTEIPEAAEVLRARFEDYLVGDGVEPAIVTEVVAPSGPLPEGVGRSFIDVSAGRITMGNSERFRATVDLSKREGRLEMSHEDRAMSFENYLRMSNAVLILKRGGVQVHSAGIVREGEGFVFFGPADAGKTTTATHSDQHMVLSDDQNVLVPEGDGVTVYGVPFRSALCPIKTSPGRARVARIMRLVQAQENRLENVPRAVGLAMLASQCPFVNFQPELSAEVLRNCQRIIDQVPVQLLHLRKGREFWSIL